MSDEKEAAVRCAAEAHHDAYERLAPDFGYATREATRVPWGDLPENVQRLMLASERAALAGVWERIEELEREKDHWQRRYLETERHRTELVAENERLREAILDIDAHAIPRAVDADGFITGGYIITVGSLHRALGVIGHSAALCSACDVSGVPPSGETAE